jgi:hypothetical protein
MILNWTNEMRELKKCFRKYNNSDYIFSGNKKLDTAYYCKYNIIGLINKILPYIYNLSTQDYSVNFILSNDDKVNKILLEYVELLNLHNINFYKACEICHVKNLIRLPVDRSKMVSVSENNLYTAEWLLTLRQLIKKPKDIKKIVILRKDKHRIFQNDILHFLLTQGFCPVVLDDMLIQDEIDLFAGVDVIIGNHGSGLANFIYSSPGTKMLEITRGDFQYVYPDLVNRTNELLDFNPKIYHQQILCDSDINASIEKTPYTNINRFIEEYTNFMQHDKASCDR